MIYKVEAPGKQTQFTYEKASWNYNTRKRAYELVATFNINMPVGISEEDIKNNQASLSVLIIAGGNNFDPQTKHLKVGFAKAASTDVTKTRQAVGAGAIANEVDLPVPLRIRLGSLELQPHGEFSARLRPQRCHWSQASGCPADDDHPQ